MNNAIVALTRGYEDITKYSDLIKRNNCIYEHINKELKYPLIIFHEGNITQAHQDYITHCSNGQLLKFVDISECWYGGYEAMCQFQTYHIWNYCKEYDYVMRIDEDCHITKADSNPFEQAKGLDYLVSKYWAESHSETNATLPDKVEALTGVSRDVFYNHKFPYTNVGVARVDFFLSKNINDILYMIAMCPDQRTNRWGDLPVLGCILNIYSDRVGIMNGITYGHLTHNNIIETNGLD